MSDAILQKEHRRQCLRRSGDGCACRFVHFQEGGEGPADDRIGRKAEERASALSPQSLKLMFPDLRKWLKQFGQA